MAKLQLKMEINCQFVEMSFSSKNGDHRLCLQCQRLWEEERELEEELHVPEYEQFKNAILARNKAKFDA
jgi:hypothetical protein